MAQAVSRTLRTRTKEARLMFGLALSSIILVVLSVAPAHSQEFLKEMPDPERVMRDIHGSDEIDTAARQYATLNLLYATIQWRYIGPSVSIPPSVQAKRDAYAAAMKLVAQRAHSNDTRDCNRAPSATDITLWGMDAGCPGWKFGYLIQHDYALYRTEFEQEILKRYFSAQWQADYAAATRPKAPSAGPVGVGRGNGGPSASDGRSDGPKLPAADREPSAPSGTGAPVGTGRAAARLSGSAAEARDLALSEIGKHFLKGPDGWTTAVREASFSGFGTAQRFVRQFRALTVESVDPVDVSPANRLNGFEWLGIVSVSTGPGREAGDPGIAFFDGLVPIVTGIFSRPRGRWTPWGDVHPQHLQVVKAKGVWELDRDVMLLRGKPPTREDFERAGVK